jgi:dTDP-4-dehydrorhamnose reductase
MTTDAPGKLFCFGLGYTAGFLARALASEGWRVAGTSREAGAAPAGLSVELFGPGRPLVSPAETLAGTTHILISVPPDAAGDPVLAEYAADILALSELRWVGYLSTTGVYGDRAGAWVDETAAPSPTGDRGRRRLAAEARWLELHRRHSLPVHVFRLAGIYGPERNVLDDLRKGRAKRIDKPGHVFSRIHVADIVATLRASIARPNPGAVYNVCDDEPASPEAVILYAATLLAIEPPPLLPFATAELSAMARSFYDDNKRVSNRRIKEELGVRLRYPSYKEGLKAILGPAAPKASA